jgi:membrane protein DedA with SNARE-associated domain
MYEIFLKVVELVNSFGYLGIFLMTFIESTFIPIPAEITLIPAGYLVSKGEMNFYLVWLASILGTIGGSLANYYIAASIGRRILLKYGKYFFIDERKLDKMESFFHKHGAISMFTGRLMPGVKHFISFPAGLAKMNIKIFSMYTILGGTLWCFILLVLGYLIGENEDLITKYLKQINFVLIIVLSCIIAVYIWRKSLAKPSNKL